VAQIGLAPGEGNSFHGFVRCAMRIVVWLLVAIWLPASSHPLLEQAGLIHQHHEGHPGIESDHGHDHPVVRPDHVENSGTPESSASSGPVGQPHEHAAGNHAAADGHCLRAAGDVRAQVADVEGRADAWPAGRRLALASAWVLDGHVDRTDGWSPPGLSPPELQCGWQFFVRAVHSVRAPSIPS
jgi:hypothetical protein